jgi:hypothetical protein
MTIEVLSTGYRNCGARAWPDHRLRESSASAPASIGGDVFPSTLAASRKALQRYTLARRGPCGSMYVRACFYRPITTIRHSHLPRTAFQRILFASMLVQRGAGHGLLSTHAEHDAGFARGRRRSRGRMWTLPELHGQLGDLAVSESCAIIRKWRLAAANNWPTWRTNWRT